MSQNQSSPVGPAAPDSSPLAKPISRRDVLRMAGAGGVGMLLGAGGIAGALAAGRKNVLSATGSRTADDRERLAAVPFYGAVQSGIITPPQDFICFASFDLTTKKLDDVRGLFRSWTSAAAAMAAGKMIGSESTNPHLPPADTGEAAELHPMNTTITFGVGPSFFDDRFGLGRKRPEALAELPPFAGDQLQPEWCGGDIAVQVCANDLQTAFHAVRNLTRIARGVAILRWIQEGFQRSGPADAASGTPRNLMGFKDGTVNPDTGDGELMRRTVWVSHEDGPDWLKDGSFLVVRRIRMRLEVWDRSTLRDQEATFGRRRESGAPLGGTNEFDEPDLEHKDSSGRLVLPGNAHVRLARGNGKEQILRRSYSFSSGLDAKTGQLDAGLLFICYQRDPRSQFIPMQQRLAKNDALNEYILHTGSAIFACFPGAREGGYIGDTLL